MIKEGLKEDTVPFSRLTKRQRYILNSLKDKQKIYVQTFVNFNYYEMCDLLKPLFKYFKRKGNIKWITMKFAYVPCCFASQNTPGTYAEYIPEEGSFGVLKGTQSPLRERSSFEGVINEVCFPYCLKYLYATISKILYDYDYFICLNYPPFGFTPPKIKIVSLVAHAVVGKTNRSDFVLECKRLGRIKY